MKRILLVGAMLFAFPAQAEPSLTLPEAIRESLATSETIQSAQAKQAGAQAKIAETRTLNLPKVSVGLMPLHLGLLDPSLGGLLNQYVPGFSPNMLSETLTVSQVLYDGGRSKLGLEAAEVGAGMAEQGTRLARQNTAYDTANAYLNVLRAESLLQAAQLTQRQAEQHLKDAQVRERTGAGNRFETLQAQTALINVQGQVIQARNAVKLARLSLGTLLHAPLGNRSLDPTPTLPTVTADEAAIQRGIEQRPEVTIANQQAHLDELSRGISAREALPVAAAQGIVVGQGMTIPATVIMGSLDWTLYDGGKTRAKVRQGDMALEADRANVAGLKEGLRLEVEKAIADRDVAREHLITSEQGLKMAKTSYDLAVLRYNKGAGSGTEVIDATTMLSQAQAGYIQSTYEKTGAELRLDKALGLDLAQLLTARRS